VRVTGQTHFFFGVGIICLVGGLEGCELGKGIWTNQGGRGVFLFKEVSMSCFFPALSRAGLCVTLTAWKCVRIRERSEDMGVFVFLGWTRLCRRNEESTVLFAKAPLESCLCCNFSKPL